MLNGLGGSWLEQGQAEGMITNTREPMCKKKRPHCTFKLFVIIGKSYFFFRKFYLL